MSKEEAETEEAAREVTTDRPAPLAPPNPRLPLYLPDGRPLWPLWGIPVDPSGPDPQAILPVMGGE